MFHYQFCDFFPTEGPGQAAVGLPVSLVELPCLFSLEEHIMPRELQLSYNPAH